MARVNWMSVATVLVLVVCVILAFFIGYYGWHNLNAALADKDAMRYQIALQDTLARQLEQKHQPMVDLLTTPDNSTEEYEFLSQLQLLMAMSGVKQVQLDRTPLTPLPSITKVAADAEAKKSRDANNRSTPSLTNLPMGVL